MAGVSVLLVEDEAAVRAAARRLLVRAGCTVREARHGADAWRFWSVDPSSVAAIVTDLHMPEMGGRELAARIHAVRPDVPVVFMSGYAEEGAGLAGPGDAFVAKPFTGAELLAALAQVVGRGRDAPAQGM
jgi:CheY-like chemotaxis protein